MSRIKETKESLNHKNISITMMVSKHFHDIILCKEAICSNFKPYLFLMKPELLIVLTINNNSHTHMFL